MKVINKTPILKQAYKFCSDHNVEIIKESLGPCTGATVCIRNGKLCIVIDENQPLDKQLAVVCHEVVHIKKFLSGCILDWLDKGEEYFIEKSIEEEIEAYRHEFECYRQLSKLMPIPSGSKYLSRGECSLVSWVCFYERIFEGISYIQLFKNEYTRLTKQLFKDGFWHLNKEDYWLVQNNSPEVFERLQHKIKVVA